MSETEKKKKSKPHPFSSMLKADEEIIWISTPTPPSLWKQIKRNLWTLQVIILFFALATFMLPRSNFPHITPGDWLLIFAGVVGIQTGLILLVIILVWLYRSYHRRERFYAITNQRVLHYIKGLQRSIPLKALPHIDVFSVDEGGGWNAYYPMWLSARDAKDVRQLMAEEQRRQDKI